MCKLNEISHVANYDDIQAVIMRTIIRQTNVFSYNQIVAIVKNVLRSKIPADSSINIDSFRVENMIQDTLSSLVDRERLYCFNNSYTPKISKYQVAFA